MLPKAKGASLMHPRKIEQILSIVQNALKEQFPEDFHKRCAYATFGTLALLKDAGVQGHAVGGDFVALVVSRNGEQASLQGFGFGEEQCSHFWLEAAGRLIDLGPYFLPEESRFPAVAMPAIAWEIGSALPAGLRYRPVQVFLENSEISATSDIRARCDAFIVKCRQIRDGKIDFSQFPTWVVTGKHSIRKAANRGDPWAAGMEHFDKIAHLQNFPF